MTDFMFQLRDKEFPNLKSQIVTSSWGGLRRATPYAFTEQGVAMLSNVLRSDRAIHVNIEIMRAFVRLRQMLASNAGLARKLAALEKKYDAQFKVVFDAIRELMPPTYSEEVTINWGRIAGGEMRKQGIVAELRDQFIKTRILNETIARNLKELGYGGW